MVKYNNIKEMFSSIDVPCFEFVDKTDEEQDVQVPSMVYLITDTNQFYGDGVVLAETYTVRLEVLTDCLDHNLFESIQAVFKTNGVAYTKDFSYDSDLNIYSTTYDFCAIA